MTRIKRGHLIQLTPCGWSRTPVATLTSGCQVLEGALSAGGRGKGRGRGSPPGRGAGEGRGFGSPGPCAVPVLNANRACGIRVRNPRNHTTPVSQLAHAGAFLLSREQRRHRTPVSAPPFLPHRQGPGGGVTQVGGPRTAGSPLCDCSPGAGSPLAQGG